MNIITLDFETLYGTNYSLSTMTTEEYIRDPRFEVIGVSVKVNDEDAVWFSGTKLATKAFLDSFEMDKHLCIAHNAVFDMSILNWHFDIRPKRIADTLSMARAVVGSMTGVSLAKLVQHFGLGEKGTEVVQAFNMRRRDFGADQLAAYGRYCCNDTELTRKLFDVLAVGFPLMELKLIDLTIRMFTEPVLELDHERLEEHLSNVLARKQKLMDSMSLEIEDLMSNPKLASVLGSLGVTPPMKVSPTTQKQTYAFAKNDEEFTALLDHPDPTVQAIVAARLGVKSTLEETRTERFIGISGRGSLPVPLRYYAAHTGRWGGDDKINLQNLQRSSPLKSAMMAPEGFMMVDSDSSQIEARTLAWLAQQDDLVDAFDRKEDVYRIMASSIYGKDPKDITKDERFVGKTTILGCFGPGTKVLTDSGWKCIVEVQAMDMLWDGEEWVNHEGVVPQGEKEVLTARGLTATPDHEILTEHGWREWSEVVTNPSLFRSAIDRASWKSFVGSSTTNQQVDPLGGTPWFVAPVAGKGLWTGTISKRGAPQDATNAQKVRRLQHGRNIGGTRLSFLTSNIANAFLTVSRAVSDAVITLNRKHIPITEVGVSLSMTHGAQTEGRFSSTLSPLTGGKTPNVTSIGWTTLKGMSRVTSALLHVAKMLVINAPPEQCRQKSLTYDIAYAGPRNRYTVATDAGAIIVHNCGYGMGPTKFKLALKNATPSVDITLDEAERIISTYRETYPRIPELWNDGKKALEAILGGRTTDLGRPGALVVNMMGIRLPNNLYVRYPGLRWVELEEGDRPQFVYDTLKGRTVIPNRIYGGKVIENVCQALARIVIGEQMLLVAKRYRPVMTVHDAIAIIAPQEEIDEAQAYVEQCMQTRPTWAPELPLACEAGNGFSYGEC